MKMPDARCQRRAEWQIGNGKWQIKGLRRYYISFAGSNKFNNTKIIQGVYLSSKRGGPPLVLLFLRKSKIRANDFLLK